MSQTSVEFLERLRHYIDSEASTQYKQLEHQWSFPLSERVAKGWAIEGLRVEDYQNQIIRLSCQTNDSRFREGDLIVLHRGNPRDPDALHCELEYDGEKTLEVSLQEGNEYFLTQQGRMYCPCFKAHYSHKLTWRSLTEP
jgi:DNA replication ATP-dependent helicase Dna2